MANDTTFVKVDCKIPQTYVGHSNPIYCYGQPYSLSTWGTNYTLQFTPSKTVISEPKTVELVAYGLSKDDILIKEIDGEITVKTKKVSGFHADIDRTYVLNNTKLVSISLNQGVLSLKFDDNEKVIYHKLE